ncbi:hypothetical protein GALL_403200 [mine drainage metagenome]|uniref:Lipoprotein LpqE n=1 Tax=mine drainage metagenome TaxID=410659 RepID=A0A1J5Q2Q4_9ZZZZ
MSTFTRTATVVALVLTLAGCGAGKDAATLKPYTPTDGVQGSAQSVKVRDVVLVSMPDGTGVVVGTVVQTGSTQDQITGITVNGMPATVTPAAPVLTQNAAIRFSGDTANASADIPGLNAVPGTLAKVEFTFGTSGTVSLDAVVRDNKDEFASVSEAPFQG